MDFVQNVLFIRAGNDGDACSVAVELHGRCRVDLGMLNYRLYVHKQTERVVMYLAEHISESV